MNPGLMGNRDFLAMFLDASNMAAIVAAAFTLLLLAKSLRDFSQTGPPVPGEVLRRYRGVLALSLGRLALATFLLANALAWPGVFAYLAAVAVFGLAYQSPGSLLAAAASLGTLAFFQFCRVLLVSPGVVAASSLYAMPRFYPLWERLSPGLLRRLGRGLYGFYVVWMALGVAALFWRGSPLGGLLVVLVHGGALLVYRLWVEEAEPLPLPPGPAAARPNLLLIGSDTLRLDRLGAAGYRRALTPTLDRLAREGALWSQCYVPCARTAPSLLSLFTGTWPHGHGVRDNFVTETQFRADLPALPRLLAEAGYQTATVGDWAASDLSKFDLGFQHRDLPADQWNLKYLLRQGPKDIRLFLSLFLNNRVGKYFLEEIHYLGGIPLTRTIGRRARRMLERLGQDERPFFLNVFMASTHPPFASEYPYYTQFADPAYRGPSKFAMAKLTDPHEIIRRQGEPREEFDLEQILDLYDGCVRSFNDEVESILSYLKDCGLADNTLVVVYSDHGMEFFEHETWGQGNSATGDYSARIPLIVSGPGVTPSRLDGVSRSIDLAPTLLDLLGLATPGEMEGVSLKAAMTGGVMPELPAFHETGIWLTDLPGVPAGHLRYPGILELLEIPDYENGAMAIKPCYQGVIVAAKDRMVRLGDWKLVYLPMTDGYLLKLYDLANDPECGRDVAEQHPERRDRLWGLLRDWMQPDRPPP